MSSKYLNKESDRVFNSLANLVNEAASINDEAVIRVKELEGILDMAQTIAFEIAVNGTNEAQKAGMAKELVSLLIREYQK